MWNAIYKTIVKGIPHCGIQIHITEYHIYVMSTIQIRKEWQPSPAKNLVESSPVKEDEKLHLEIVSRQNTDAMYMIGLSWIFFEDDF